MWGCWELGSRAKRNERLACKQLRYLHRAKTPDNQLPEPQENPTFQQYFTLFLPGISVSVVGEAELTHICTFNYSSRFIPREYTWIHAEWCWCPESISTITSKTTTWFLCFWYSLISGSWIGCHKSASEELSLFSNQMSNAIFCCWINTQADPADGPASLELTIYWQ